MKEGSVDEMFDDLMNELKGSVDDFVYRRINNVGFAKVVFFLCGKSRTEDFIVCKDLAKFRGFTISRAMQVMNDLDNIKIMRKVYRNDNFAEFWFVRDELGNAVVMKYLKMACRTLGIKNKLIVEKKI